MAFVPAWPPRAAAPFCRAVAQRAASVFRLKAAAPEDPAVTDPQDTIRMSRLLKRRDFLLCAKGAKRAMPTVVVQMLRRDDGNSDVRVGLTATKKLGGAVERNRRRRRLREAMRAIGPLNVEPGCDYVLIAREGTAAAPWPVLLEELGAALTKVKRGGQAPDKSPRSKAERPDGF
jgi:ribonuclease P protein component